LDATGVAIEWIEREAGAGAAERCGSPLPPETLSAIQQIKVALKGPTATPIGTGFRSVNVELRQKLDLFANFRPARSLSGIRTPWPDVDLIVVRENTEGLYSGLEHVVVPGVVESLRVVTERASRRVVRFAFETARKYGRRKVTAVHKANILKLSDGLFLRVAREVAAQFTDIEFEDAIVDATAMRLVTDPGRFDVLVMENLFGDIISDLTSGLVGGLGVTPSANIGTEAAVFEAVHGSAPDIAGRGIANPTALILSGALLLRHIGEGTAAESVEQAVSAVIAEGRHTTGDLGGTATTDQFVDALISAMHAHAA
jgi:isocitrate dehydrogenase (NAD+)